MEEGKPGRENRGSERDLITKVDDRKGGATGRGTRQ